MHNYFQLLDMPLQFPISTQKLEEAHRLKLIENHPDKNKANAHLTDTLCALINQAYHTLSDPLLAACHLLQLKGIDALDETNTTLPTDFLIEQMQLREALEDAQKLMQTDLASAQEQLTKLERLCDAQISSCTTELIQDLQQDNLSAAASQIRKWQYYRKLKQLI